MERLARVAVGIVSIAAATVGVGSIPTPWSEPGWSGWLVWRSVNYPFQFVDGTGVLIWNRTQEVDSKAMRKVGPDETVVIVAESQAGAFEISTPVRQLYKLS